MAVGALEPRFFQALIQGLSLAGDMLFEKREDRSNWPAIQKIFQDRFLQKTRDDCAKAFHDTDACCTPVLEQSELEANGYEQRIPISLSASAGHPIDPESAWMSNGLAPGHLGEERLTAWTGWKKGINYRLEDGGLVKNLMAKL